MAQDLITENIEVGAPANPVIVQNVASLPGGTRLYVTPVGEDYPGGVIDADGDYLPKVLKAGHIVLCTDVPYAQTLPVEDGYFTTMVGDAYMFVSLGVITEDTPVYKNDEGFYEANAPVMVMGVVDAAQMPAKVKLGFDEEEDVPLKTSNFCCGLVFINTMAE